MSDRGLLPRAGVADEDDELSLEELTALALAAEEDPVIDGDAVPWSLVPLATAAVLPGWYMPQALQTRCRGWRAGLVVVVIAAFLIVDAFGLCSTYG